MDTHIRMEWNGVEWALRTRHSRNANGSLELHEVHVLEARWPNRQYLSRPEDPCEYCRKSEIGTLLRFTTTEEFERRIRYAIEMEISE